MKKMELVGLGGTTAKHQHDGDTSPLFRNSNSDSHDSAHNHDNEHGLTDPGPGRRLSDDDDDDTSDAAADQVNENETPQAQAQDHPLLPHDGNDDFEENDNPNPNDVENGGNERQLLRPQRSPSAPSNRDDTTCLPEDTFSFLISSDRRSAFFLAIFVFALQIAIYFVLAADITTFSYRYNILHFPANVETSVRVAEFLAGVVAVFTQDDTRKAVNLIREASYSCCCCCPCQCQCQCVNINQDLQDKFPGTTKFNFFLSIALRTVEGVFWIFITFLLIMQSTTVIDLLLNFTAMEFVSQLDDVAFTLTKEGYFGRELQKEAENVLNISYRSRLPSASESRRVSFAVVSFFAVWLCFFAGMYGWIVAKQKRGDYFCHNIFAQFGDDVMPTLGTLSGLFHQRRDTCCHYGGRVSYFRNDKNGEALLAYCEEQERWTISLHNVNATLTEDDEQCEDNPCNKYDPCNWIAASSVSQDFDVLTTANSEWFVRDGPKRISSLSQHFLACHDCIFDDDFCGEDGGFGDCSAKRRDWEEGWNSTCACNTGRYGFQCEYQPCQMLEISQSDKPIEKQDGTSSNSRFASKYYRLEGVEAYNRPVYTSASLDDDQMISDGTDIILFTGVRWILSSKELFPGLKDNKNVTEYFSQFHLYFTDYNAPYVSEPVYIGRLDDEASPSGLQWLHASGASQQIQPDLQKGPIGTKFCCDDCSNGE